MEIWASANSRSRSLLRRLWRASTSSTSGLWCCRPVGTSVPMAAAGADAAAAMVGCGRWSGRGVSGGEQILICNARGFLVLGSCQSEQRLSDAGQHCTQPQSHIGWPDHIASCITRATAKTGPTPQQLDIDSLTELAHTLRKYSKMLRPPENEIHAPDAIFPLHISATTTTSPTHSRPQPVRCPTGTAIYPSCAHSISYCHHNSRLSAPPSARGDAQQPIPSPPTTCQDELTSEM